MRDGLLTPTPGHDWAHSFVQALLDPGTVAPSTLRDPAGSAAGRRFAVYRNNVVVGLVEALAANFPVLERLLGPDGFRGLAGAFVRRHPPRSRLLHDYGDRFPDFIAAEPQLSHLPYLADVATLERARLAAYHAEDAAVLDGAFLSAMAPEDLAALRLRPHPATHLVRSRYAIVSIWSANRPGSDPGRTDGARPETALVTRPEAEVETRSIPDDAASFIDALLGGQTLIDAATAATQRSPDFDLPAAIRLAVSSGAFRADPS